MRLHASPPASTSAICPRRLDRLLRLLPHAVDDGPGLVRRRRLGRDAGETTLGGWRVGTRVNLERSLRLGDELGGHIVSGHVDGVGEVGAAVRRGQRSASTFRGAAAAGPLHRPQGLVAIDGVSLTVNEVEGRRFGVNIIPHTRPGHHLRDAAGRRRGQHRDRHAGALRRAAGGDGDAELHEPRRVSRLATEELIEEARNGRMFILVDDEDRENEGDLVIPAQIRHARRDQLHGPARPRPDLPGADPPARSSSSRLPLMSAAQRHAAPDRLHRLDRGARRRHHRHLGARPRAHRRGGDQPGKRPRATSSRPATSSR